MCSLLVLLLVPSSRQSVQTGLRAIDSMAQEHKPEEYAAVRRISTATGGYCTVLAVLVALASSTALVLDFAFRNSATSDGLQVATAGAQGASRAAAAKADVVLDAVMHETTIAPCDRSVRFDVGTGQSQPSAE